MKNIKFRDVLREIPAKKRRDLLFLSLLRIMANGLDLAGLAGIALLATAFGSIASGTAREAPLQIPLVGEVYIAEREAVVIAFGIAVTFVLKSVFSVWLTLKTSLKVAELEGDFAERLTIAYFRPDSPESQQSKDEKAVARFQNSVLGGTSALSGFLNSVIGLIAEGSLAISLLAVFFFVNPLATLGTMVYFAGVLVMLNSQITRRLKRNAIRSLEGSEKMLQSSRDLFGIRREAAAAGTESSWLRRVVDGKRVSAQSAAVNNAISSLPRYVLETSLILGIFGFMAIVVIFSDLSSQSVTIGIFMAGGLRLVASILPIQNAFNAMSSSAAAGGKTLMALQRAGAGRLDPENELLKADYFRQAEPALDLRLDQVSFSYDLTGEPALEAVSFAVQPNTKTAIVGPSGSGKTTLFELATGRLQPTSGVITISGQLPQPLIKSNPGAVGIVPQRPNLIQGSLAANVALHDESFVDLERAADCLVRAGLESFVGPNQSGLLREISPDSGELSGGEIQRLGLARALYRRPRLLFLDEATSALDAETEDKISQVLDGLRDEMTVVLIAHRLSTVMNADNIIYLNKGKVVAQGTFAELKKNVPDFAKAVELMDLGD